MSLQPIPRNLPGSSSGMRLSRPAARALTNLQGRTMMRLANVQSEGMVVKEKMREVDHVAREAMVGQAMLRQMVHTLAAGDAILADELDIFAGIARMGKAQVLQDMVDVFAREGFGL